MGFLKKSLSMIVKTTQARSRKARQILLRDSQLCQSLRLARIALDVGSDFVSGEAIMVSVSSHPIYPQTGDCRVRDLASRIIAESGDYG